LRCCETEKLAAQEGNQCEATSLSSMPRCNSQNCGPHYPQVRRSVWHSQPARFPACAASRPPMPKTASAACSRSLHLELVIRSVCTFLHWLFSSHSCGMPSSSCCAFALVPATATVSYPTKPWKTWLALRAQPHNERSTLGIYMHAKCQLI
jgi:hypothetical protein